MPRHKKLKNPEVALPKGPERPVVSPLVYEERVHLLRLLEDPIFKRAWRNAELSRPHLFTAAKEETNYPQACSHRLHQLQGWEMFQIALLRQTNDPKLPATKPVETFPDAGTLEAEIALRNPSKPKNP